MTGTPHDDDDFFDPIPVDSGHDDLNAFDFVQGQNGQRSLHLWQALILGNGRGNANIMA